jgi:glycyl-tRNA synthetase
MFLATMSNALMDEQVPGQDDPENIRTVLKLHPALAPIKAAILPLKRTEDQIVGKAKEVFDKLKMVCNCQYDDTGSIGKLYRRQDAIGTPFCITVDFESLDDNMVTVRDRDTLEQERVPIDKVAELVRQRTDMSQLFM